MDRVLPSPVTVVVSRHAAVKTNLSKVGAKASSWVNKVVENGGG